MPTRRAVLDLLLLESRRRYLDAEAEQLRTKRILSMDLELVRGDRRIIDLSIVHKCELNASGEIIGFFGAFQDISERKTAERELEKLAFFDPLTGLANRALFQRRIQEAMRDTGGRPLLGGALLMLDLDRFKEVNDSLGNQAGDELLKRMTERLMRTLSADVFLARLGGDEFAAILPGPTG